MLYFTRTLDGLGHTGGYETIQSLCSKTNLIFKQDADEQFDRVGHAQDVEELEQVVVEEWQLLWYFWHAQRDGVTEAPKPNRLSRTGQRDVVKQVEDQPFEYLTIK